MIISPGSLPMRGILSPNKKTIPISAMKIPAKIRSLPIWWNSGIL